MSPRERTEAQHAAGIPKPQGQGCNKAERTDKGNRTNSRGRHSSFRDKITGNEKGASPMNQSEMTKGFVRFASSAV